MNAKTIPTISSARLGRPQRARSARAAPSGAAEGPPFQAAEEAKDMVTAPHVNVNDINMRNGSAAFKRPNDRSTVITCADARVLAGRSWRGSAALDRPAETGGEGLDFGRDEILRCVVGHMANAGEDHELRPGHLARERA